MPIRVRASRELGLIVVEFAGVVTTAEVAQHMLPLIDAPEYALMPLTLLDMTAALRLDFSGETVRSYARRVSGNVDEKIEAGARMALVATRDEFFGVGRMYQMLRGRSPVELQVFRDRREAEQWLEMEPGYETRLAPVGDPDSGAS